MTVHIQPVTFDAASDLDTIRAFLVHPQDVFVLNQGTWHWGPFPLTTEPVRLLNVQGLRYAEDNDCVMLTEALGALLLHLLGGDAFG